MIETVRVELAERAYDIQVGEGLLPRAGALIAPYLHRSRVAVLTDETVAGLHLDTLREGLSAQGIAMSALALPPGEATKGWPQFERAVEWLLDEKVERRDVVVALGGGVIGDLAGFAAAVLRRGVRFVQIPTSLLAQVDSSVGGKTAINTPAGKNLVGAFHQPAMVLIDPATLDTLPLRQVRAGYAEVVKYGLIDDPHFFAWCEANFEALYAGDSAARETAIARSVAAKARIVAEDERETTGKRALLNLGHTFGHALEAESGFSDRLFHGEAVAAGMALAFAYSAEKGLCPKEDSERVKAHLRAAGLPHDLASAGIEASGARLADHMRHDKKMAAGTLPFLLAHGVGQTYLDRDVALDEVAAFLDRCDRG